MELDINLLQNTLCLPLAFQETIDISSDYGLCEEQITVCFDGSITKELDFNVGFYTLEGQLQFTLSFLCDKCLEKVSLPMSLDVCESFVQKGSDVSIKPPRPGGSLGEDFFYFEGEFIDLTKALEILIYLNIPSKVVCREDCKGLCPHCGYNLNQGDCDCDEAGIDPRFFVLKSFFKDKEV